MSGPDDIPPGPVSRAKLLEALSNARDVPVEALDEAARAPAKIADKVLALTARAGMGEDLSEGDANLLFWGIHVLAEVGDTRLCAPLLRVLRLPSPELHDLLGDATTETLQRVVVAVYDGDEPALLHALADRETAGFARWSLFSAAIYLVATGRIGRERMQAFLRDFDDRRTVADDDDGWNGWADAICLLGFSDLFPRVEVAFGDDRFLEIHGDLDECREMLAAAESRPDDLGRLAEHGLHPFGNAVDELDWVAPADEGEGQDPVWSGATRSDGPAQNPYRDVGRNDPCPCGSGKKFKKCCLEAS